MVDKLDPVARGADRAKSEFLVRMSHELRTPLNALLGFAQLLLADRRQPLYPEQRRRVEHIERAGHELLALIEDSMDIARLDAGEPRAAAADPCDPAASNLRRSRRVLYIGDEQADRELIEATVRALPDVTLTTATDGRSGIPTARILRADLVIVGLKLHDMTGATALRALRQQPRTREVRCVALSDGLAPDAEAEAQAAGFLECWCRPLGVDTLRSRLQALLP